MGQPPLPPRRGEIRHFKKRSVSPRDHQLVIKNELGTYILTEAYHVIDAIPHGGFSS